MDKTDVCVCVCLCVSMWTIALSGPGRVTCICCCSVSNVGGWARWQQGWMRRVWRASSPWWSRHLKPVLLHLSTELVWIWSFLFFCMQSLNILSGLLVSLLFCFVLSLRFLSFVFIVSSFAFFLSPSICPLPPLLSSYFIRMESPFLFLPHLSFSRWVSGVPF